jgi:hypothetical protein
MAITEDVLAQLDGRSYGPVSFRSSGGEHAGTLGDREAAIALDGDTVSIATTLSVPWPQGGEATDVDRNVTSALSFAAALRPELVVMTADRASATATVTLWIDADASGLPDLATAVRTCVLLGDVAWRAVDSVAMAVTGREEILRESAEAQSRLEEAEQALGRMAPLPEDAGPAPAVSPPPPTELAPEVAATTPPPAPAGERFCPACGTRNDVNHRFCISCGQNLQS